MRFYTITISDSGGSVLRKYTSLNADGSYNPAALRVGNWQGLEVTLDLIVANSLGSADNPKNFAFAWNQGQTLTDMVTNILGQAYPGSTIEGSFSPDIVATHTLQGFYQNIRQFGQTVLNLSKSINASQTYLGASIVQRGNGFFLWDGTGSSDQPTEISFTDMIGNATWSAQALMTFKTVMRGDLACGMVIKMPPGSNVINAQNTFTKFLDQSSFQNTFQIYSLRHVGDYRQADADSWCTVVQASLNNVPTTIGDPPA